MKRTLTSLLAALAFAIPVSAQTPPTPPADPHAGHDMQQPAAASAVNDKLPPSAETAGAALKQSPRHSEWVDIKVSGSPDVLKTFVVFPERKDKAPVVVVIHEIFGLSEWIRGVADQLAKDGFIAIAPDLLSGKGPNGGGTDELGDKATQVIRTLTPDEVILKLNAVREYGLKLPAASGKSAVVGYCWGGSTSFNYAVRQPALNAAVVYYGSSPADAADYGKINAAVLGLYGEDDARVNQTIPTAETEMKKAGKVYEKHMFPAAGHGFLRQQSGTQKVPGANLKATEQAWPIMLEFLRKTTR